MIKLKHVTASYESSTAVQDVSFHIKEGETLGLLGPNGAGKTTLVHLILGIRKPDSGTITTRWTTNVLNEIHRSHFGVVPQDPSLYDHLTGRENLTFFGQMYDLSGSTLRERVENSLSIVGLTDRASDPVKTYSNGMKRRLSFAGALTHQPDVLLLDEPLSGVDPKSRSPVLECLETLHKESRTILYLTHDMQEAQRRCNRAGFLKQGQLLALDQIDKLLEEHGGKPSVEITLARLPDDPEKLPGTLTNSTLRIQTDHPGRMISKLEERGLEFTEYHVRQPDLASVFMNLTGDDTRNAQNH